MDKDNEDGLVSFPDITSKENVIHFKLLKGLSNSHNMIGKKSDIESE